LKNDLKSLIIQDFCGYRYHQPLIALSAQSHRNCKFAEVRIFKVRKIVICWKISLYDWLSLINICPVQFFRKLIVLASATTTVLKNLQGTQSTHYKILKCKNKWVKLLQYQIQKSFKITHNGIKELNCSKIGLTGNYFYFSFKFNNTSAFSREKFVSKKILPTSQSINDIKTGRESPFIVSFFIITFNLFIFYKFAVAKLDLSIFILVSNLSIYRNLVEKSLLKKNPT